MRALWSERRNCSHNVARKDSVSSERDYDEFGSLKSFRYPDSLLPYITSVLEHCRAIIDLRVPVEVDVIFPLAPTWNEPPIDDS